MEGHTKGLPESNSGFRWHIKQGANWLTQVSEQGMSESALIPSQVAWATLVVTLKYSLIAWVNSH